MLKKILLFIFIGTVLLSCINNNGVNKNNSSLAGDDKDIEKLVDARKVISETKERNKDLLEIGPSTDNKESAVAHKEYHDILNKEESFDYASVDRDAGKGEIFNIDLNVENVEIRSFMHMMSEITGVNFLVSDEVKGYVSAKLNNVPWPSALDSVLNLKHLAKYVDQRANIIRIHTQDAIVNLENFERQRKEDLQKTILLEKASQPLYTEIFKLFYTKPDKVKSIVESVLGSSGASSNGNIRNTNAQITVDDRMNQIIVKARKEDIDMVAKLINHIDSRTQQVFIEAFIVEVDDSFQKALGARIGGNLTNNLSKVDNGKYHVTTTGVAGTGITGSTQLTPGNNNGSLVELPVANATSGIGILTGVSSDSLKFELSAMEQKGLSKTISNPRIFTLDNQKALIFQGTEVPYSTVSTNGTQVQFKEAGIRLEVTPSIIGDGNLVMAIKVNNDSVDTTVSNPPITKSEINTNLVTRDSSVVVIGGLYILKKNNAKSQVPLLGDIPIAGHLFSNNSKLKNKTELMIFMAPKIL